MVGQTASSGRIGEATQIKRNKEELYPKAKIPRIVLSEAEKRREKKFTRKGTIMGTRQV